MPIIHAAGTRLYYRLEGRDDRPVLMLAHSLGCDHGMWDPQVPALLDHFRVLRYDHRGHGASETTPGDFSMESLARDALALADALAIPTFAFCGLSMGGMVGQWLAAEAPDRITHVVLANTSPRMDAGMIETRRKAVLDAGMALVADLAMSRFFSPAFLARRTADVASVRSVFLATDLAGYAACCAAIRDMDHTALLGRCRVPALIICGDLDTSTPWAGHGEVLARGIPGARVAHLPAAHLSNIERPRSFTALLLDFLLPRRDGADSGDRMRRAVLGDAHVDRAARASSDFNRDFQELITSYAWGAVWCRPALDIRTRRLLVLAITASLGRWEEFRLHARAGLAHDLEPSDLCEVLLQTAIYAGVPAANTGFHIAAELMSEFKPE